jgi:UDP-N-acetylglucosamine 4,6-dehydratase
MTGYLITGGSGSFGRAIVPYLLNTGAERVVAMARHETEMAQLEADFYHPNLRCFLGDVRDIDRLKMAMRGCDIVVHAAALKRIEQAQRDPYEAIHTNVLGTANVTLAAMESNVSKALLLSTDKASAPINLYGATKLCAEHLFLAANGVAAGRCKFSVLRYGNIWGSRGSVVPKWIKQVEEGRLPLKVTDANATRFYMPQIEAVRMAMMVLETMPDRVFVPYDLKAYRIADLLIALGVNISEDCQYIGLPEHEKLHEQLGFDDLGRPILSNQAARLTIEELEQAIQCVN